MTNLVIFVLVTLVLWTGVLTFYLFKIRQHYHRLVEGTNKRNLTDILEEIIQALKENKKTNSELRASLNQLAVEAAYHVQKIGVVRFNPFADTGGEQSFVLAVLDGNNDGIVLTSLHGRGATRWYIKGVNQGKGRDYDLSEEELKAVKKATKGGS